MREKNARIQSGCSIPWQIILLSKLPRNIPDILVLIILWSDSVSRNISWFSGKLWRKLCETNWVARCNEHTLYFQIREAARKKSNYSLSTPSGQFNFFAVYLKNHVFQFIFLRFSRSSQVFFFLSRRIKGLFYQRFLNKRATWKKNLERIALKRLRKSFCTI